MKSKKKINNSIILTFGIIFILIIFLLVFNYFFSSEPDFKITKNGVEVDSNNITCFGLCKDKPECCLRGWMEIQTYDEIIKSFEKNCLCQSCEGTYDTVYDDYVTCDIKCSKYKCGEYQVEVLR